MSRLNGIKKLQLLIIFLAMSLVVYAKVTGPEPGYTGATGDLGTCVACHDTFHTENVGPGSVNVSGGPIGGIYQPGQQYMLTITVQQANRQRYGFQLTAIDKNLNRAGSFAAPTDETQVLAETGAGGRQYIEHTELGTASFGGGHSWQVGWTAPATDVGTVRFFVAGNAANGDGTNQNDYIYTNSAITDSQRTFVGLTLNTDPANQILQSGSVYHVVWSTSGTANIDNIELRYSTDDGASFPITNQIFFTTDATATSMDWTVPALVSTKTILRVRIGKKSGDSVEVKSGRFTITDGSVSLGPVITSAEVSGKKLRVIGQNFGDGATLYMCSDCATPATEGNKVKKVSNNEETPSTMVVAKKAGKEIAHGSTVILQVKNPDGALSNAFTFTRP